MSGLCILFLLTTFTGLCLAGDFCYNPADEVFYCNWGCCGDGDQIECCSFAVWIIVLSVIGGVSLIGVLICVTCVCICQKRARARAGNGGRIIQTHATQQPVITYAGNAYGVPMQGEVNQGFAGASDPGYYPRNAKY